MRPAEEATEALRKVARDCLLACDGVLARVWILGPGDRCASCPMRPECPDQRACLHLVVSEGLTTRIDGPYRRFPIGARRVGRVVTELAPYLERGDLAERGLADRAWLALNGVRSFAAVPLEGGRGVLALFSRRFLTDPEVKLLALAARVAWPDVSPAAAPERRTLAEIERQAIERVLAQTQGRISGPRGAAVALGLKPSTLASRMKKLGVRRPK